MDRSKRSPDLAGDRAPIATRDRARSGLRCIERLRCRFRCRLHHRRWISRLAVASVVALAGIVSFAKPEAARAEEELPQLFPAFPQAKDAFFGERPVREASATMNAALQAAYFIVGVRAAGLAAGPMTGLDFEGVRKEFLDDDHTPLMVVNIGRPGENAWYPRSPRLSFDEVVTTV